MVITILSVTFRFYFNLFLERGTTEMHRKRLSYLAANQWNNLPDEVKKAKTLNGFKRKLNASILQ